MTSIGMNLAAPVYYVSEAPFIDRFKTSSGWVAQGGNGAALPVQLDSAGNPLAIPTGATSFYTNVGVDLVSDPTSDTYILTYAGAATFRFAGATVLSSAPGSITLRIDNPSTSWFPIYIETMTSPLHDIHLVRQDQVNLFNGGEIFNPTFIAKTANWDVIRFMDWSNVNTSPAVTWADRSTESGASWANSQYGVPIEVMVKLANKAHTDMWYNVPMAADDNYVRSALSLIRDTLDPSLKVHVEYSNEAWNWAFPVARVLERKAADLWGVDANHDGVIDVGTRAETLEAGNMVYYGYRSAQIAKIAHDVFGTAGANRVVDVLGAQTVWPELTTYYTLNGIARAQSGTTSSLFSEYAVTTYFGWQTDTAANREIVLGWARSGAAGMTAAFRELESGGAFSDDQSLAAQVRYYAQQGVIARANGMQLVAYEGGAHLVVNGFSDAEANEVTAFYGRLMEDSRMGTLYTKMIDDFAAAGGKSLLAYNDVGTNAKWGWWGVLDTINDTGSPRYDALLQAALRNHSAATTPVVTTPVVTTPVVTTPVVTTPVVTTPVVTTPVVTAPVVTTPVVTTPVVTTPVVTTPVTPVAPTIPTLGAGRATLAIEGGGAVTVGSNGFAVAENANARTLVFSGGGLSGDVTVRIPTGAASFEVNPVDGTLLKLSASTATISGPIANIEGTNAGGQALTITDSLSHRIVGTAGADRLTGGSAGDQILGGAGADTILGGAGNDHLYGQSSNGGPDGADSISGGDGSDYIQGNAGNDTLDGGAGSDRIYGGADNDSVLGGAGNDTINGNLGDDTLAGGADNDSIRGGQGNDLIYGDTGDDIIGGDLGNDTLVGGAGFDRMTGGDGADTFRFAPGDAAYAVSGDTWVTDAITDFAGGIDKLALGFTVASVLTGQAQASVKLAADLAQALFNNHAGDREVAAINVGSDTMLFFAGNGGGVIDSAVKLVNVSAGPVLADFA